jgi:KAP family P-loop domain
VAAHIDREEVLGRIGATSCSIVVTQWPWEVDADTLLLLIERDDLGEVGTALARRYPGLGLRSLSLPALTAGGPAIIKVDRSSGQYGLLNRVVVAAVPQPLPSWPQPDYGVLAADLVSAAARAGAAVLAVPTAGAAAARIVGAIIGSVPPVSGLDLLRRLVLVCADNGAAAELRAAWRAARTRPGVGPTAAGLTIGAEATLIDAAHANGGRADATSVIYAALRRAPRTGETGQYEVARHLRIQLIDRVDPASTLARFASAAGLDPDAAGSEVDLDSVPLLDAATRYAAATGSPGIVHTRHLLAAAVTAQPPPAAVLDVLGLTADGLAEGLYQAIRNAKADEPMEPWAEILLPTSGVIELTGGISADHVDPDERLPLSRDHLGVSTYVTMLASVIAREDTPLPLSIGLFGEWGSGKSYFMSLLREQVRVLSGSPGYQPGIVQIGFNAWSYADTNIWASLGNEIFGALADPGHEGWRERLRADLDQTLQRARDLAAAKENAQRVTVRLRAELDRARRAREKSAKELLAKAAHGDRAAAELDRIWLRLGITDEAVRSELLAGELRGVRTDGSALRLALGGRRALWLAVAVAAVVAMAGAAILWPGVARWLGGIGLTGLAAIIAGGAALIGRARLGLRSLTAFARTVKDTAVAEELRRVRAAEAEEQVVTAELDEVLARAGELGRELADFSPGQRLYSFVTERAGSDDYRGELGLISIVRRDLQQLAALMKEWDGAPERIVLYIDDLDRCPPRQVVDVLQAVHLLLALDLFVVVIGVDPRWLEDSLRKQHPDQLTEDRPRDYLEKIVNIPFRLPGMTAESFGRLIRDLSGVPESTVDKTPPATGPDEEIPGDSGPIVRYHALPAGPAGPSGPGVERGSEVAAIRQGRPPALQPLTEPELDLIAALAPLVRSPREAKRLLNLYRLIRATRDLSDASTFLGGEYQAVIVLLGVLIARPHDFGDFLDRLLQQDRSGSWAGFVTNERPVAGLEPATSLVTLADLSAFHAWGPHVERFSFSGAPR